MAAPVVPGFGVAMPLCLIWRALVAGVGATNSGTTTGPATPTGAKWMWPATNVSLALLRMWVLNSIVPSARTLISVWPLASDVEPVVSDLAVSFECRTQVAPRPFFAVAPPTLRAATTDAAKTTSNRRRINSLLPLDRSSDVDPPASRSLRCGEREAWSLRKPSRREVGRLRLTLHAEQARAQSTREGDL